jgi:hypothetical protein
MAERASLALINNAGNRSILQGTDVVPARLVIRESTGPVPR